MLIVCELPHTLGLIEGGRLDDARKAVVRINNTLPTLAFVAIDWDALEDGHDEDDDEGPEARSRKKRRRPAGPAEQLQARA